MFYNQSHPGTDGAIQDVLGVLKDIIKLDGAHWGDGTGDLSVDQRLFLLQTKDVTAVAQALDSMRIFGQALCKPCNTYLAAYKNSMNGGQHGPFPPEDPDTVKRWKKEHILAMKRNWIVAQRVSHSGVRLDHGGY